MNWKEELSEYFKDRYIEGADMSMHTTYKTGGKAEALVYPKTVEDWGLIIKLAKLNNIPFRVLGLGSNVLVSDSGLPGITASTREMLAVEAVGDKVMAEAGAALDKLIEVSVANGLGGMEKMSGIPGSVGGAVWMNAGAFGQETFDTLEYVNVIDQDARPYIIQKKDICHGYRKGVCGCAGEVIVLSAAFRLTQADSKALYESRNNILAKRIEKQPLDLPSAGSVFKRPGGDFASRLIDESGLRGLSVGGAKVSEKHAGFIVNFNRASAEDIYNLIKEVQRIVKEKTGKTLELEQILWGRF
ncbi:UDP-N-acetylmuramate dehydrogenase [Parelusimicrobium proximum]|uniref:UDP-N-acetylmuramate dehydrogenase n=1 Tax=Parelusimicrobium proximum TaxID=3228953 RepID=UPI003D17792C